MKELFIIRGLPGSGKSTFAYKLGGIVCEADQFFIQQDGVYRWDRTQLPHAHNWCKKKVRCAMEDGTKIIAVANTFVRRVDMLPYAVLANTYGYRITEVTMTGPLYTSIHNVPAENLQRMKDQWEK